MEADPVHEARKPNRMIWLVLLALAVLAAFAYWKLSRPEHGPYGAIAMSDSSLTYGGSWGFADPITAYKRAIAECRGAGAGDCVVKVSLKESCAALAVSVERNDSYMSQGRDQVANTTAAMQACRATGAGDCSIRENICSSDS